MQAYIDAIQEVYDTYASSWRLLCIEIPELARSTGQGPNVANLAAKPQAAPKAEGAAGPKAAPKAESRDTPWHACAGKGRVFKRSVCIFIW